MVAIQILTAQIRFIQLHGHEKGSKIPIALFTRIIEPWDLNLDI